ncbi:MAG: cation:proton antiporter [Campylobacterales bacterium]
MGEQNLVIFILGCFFLLGLIADLAGRYTILPRVTVLLLSGILIGPHILDLLPPFFIDDWFEIITNIALGMIGFLLGQKFTYKNFRNIGKSLIIISIMKVLITFFIVFIGLMLIGVNSIVAMIIASIASPSAPAAIYDVIEEIKPNNNFSNNILSIVAIDDLWGLLLFTICISLAGVFTPEGHWYESLANGGIEIFGSIAFGICIGSLGSFLTGRVRPGQPTQAEALGIVLIAVSIAKFFDLSPLLATMVTGAVVANLATHHKRPFIEIENLEWPFIIMFFLLAGASLHLESLMEVGIIGVVYIATRSLGIYLGCYAGGIYAQTDSYTKNRLGLALLPQAGVAIGLALMSGNYFPEYKNTILPIIIGSTVVFELIGPILTRVVVARSKVK